uniref:OSJNBa0028M15.11 protein n=1 Tax=Oryza sativa subsp. japonica TaxID=39947 RepID=Q7XK76_ORYSJ|nr:OSJNBa0028M15.11 [Oryza sativa Japonica Group]
MATEGRNRCGSHLSASPFSPSFSPSGPAENEAERRRTGSSQSPARMSPRRDAPVVMGAKTTTRWERVTAAWTGSGGERRRRQQHTASAVADEGGANEVGRREAAENVVEGMVGEHCGGGNLTAARLLLRRRRRHASTSGGAPPSAPRYAS